MEKNWKILNLKRKSENDLVTEVTYVIKFSLQGKEDRHVGVVTLEENSEEFIEYSEITEEVALDWVKEKLGQEEIDRIVSETEDRILERIQREQNPPFKKGLPWKNNEE